MAAPSIIVLAADNWNIGVEVTVTGQADGVDDGDTAYDVKVSPIVSDDEEYKDHAAVEVAMVNIDDPINLLEIQATPGQCTTTEAGGECVVSVSLNDYWFTGGNAFSAFKTVTVTVSTNDPTEGKLYSSVTDSEVVSVVLTFDESNWDMVQEVRVVGVDDDIEDFDIDYAISLSGSLETEAGSTRGIAVSKITDAIAVVNTDDDVSGLMVSTPSTLTTTESGDSATFTVRLQSQPMQDVTIVVVESSNATEAMVSQGASLVFTSINWNVEASVVIMGQDDDEVDGDKPYTVVGVAQSGDVAYTGLNFSFSMVNSDNDEVSTSLEVTQDGVQLAGQLNTHVDETGASTSFEVKLPSAPSEPATVTVVSSDEGEGMVDPAELVFDATNWNVPQTVTVVGQDDDEADGEQVFTITMAVSSADSLFDGTGWSLSTKNLDDDVLQLSKTACTTTEAAINNTCSVSLSLSAWNDHFAEVSVVVATGNEGEGTLSSTQFVFGASDWETLRSW
jgi:hypothetical protein